MHYSTQTLEVIVTWKNNKLQIFKKQNIFSISSVTRKLLFRHRSAGRRYFHYEGKSYINSSVEEDSSSSALTWPLLLTVSLLAKQRWLLRSPCRPSLRFLFSGCLKLPEAAWSCSFLKLPEKRAFVLFMLWQHANMLTDSLERERSGDVCKCYLSRLRNTNVIFRFLSIHRTTNYAFTSAHTL